MKINRVILFINISVFLLANIFFQTSVFAQKEPDLGKIYNELKTRKGKHPIIIIPGIQGSELINKDTKEKVWFSFSRSGDDDLSLPITNDLKTSRDKLIPGDIIREVDLKLLPNIKVYQGLIKTLEEYGGYEEASWDNPPKNINDKFFVYPYDWRRDNVETAQLLIKKIDELKRKTKNPNIKFNILAHSMGGLIARYAAMYGAADLPVAGVPKPTWAGEKYFGKIFFFATPNEGSMEAIDAVLKGTSSIGAAADLPFIRNLTPLDVATMPSIYQLLPHPKTGRFYDENLQPMDIKLYDVAAWKKYSWGVYSDEKSLKDFSPAERRNFERYFEMVLNRAQKFHQALDAYTTRRVSVGMFIIGGDCIDTLDAVVLHQDDKGKWKTLTKPSSFKNSKGEKITDEMLKQIMIAPGDGRVTRRSTLAETLVDSSRRNVLFDSLLPLTSALFICESHENITSNSTIQNNFLTALISEASQN